MHRTPADAHLSTVRLLSAGPVTLDQDSRTVRAHDRLVRLTPMEVSVLELMLLRRGAPSTRADLMRGVRLDADETDERIIDVFVCRLRKKLADAGVDGVVVTVSGQGYAARHPYAAQQAPAWTAGQDACAPAGAA